MKNLCIPAVIIFLLVIFVPAVSESIPPAPWEVNELMGQTAPEFSLNDLNGNLVTLSTLRGKVVFLNFFASWCPPCKEEIPSLNKLSEKYAGKDFIVIGISTDSSRKDLLKFVETYNVSFTTLHDKDSKISREYKVFSIPMSFIIDRSGKLAERFLGANDWLDPEFLRKIESLL